MPLDREDDLFDEADDTPISGPEMSPGSLILSGFMQRILHPFQRKEIPTTSLKGRAQKIIPKLNEMISELESLEKTEEKDDLFIHFIIGPLIKEGYSLREQILSYSDTLRHKLISQYVLWVDRSFKWVELSKKESKSDLVNAVKKFLIEETLSIIKKDIALINDYWEQQIENLDIEEGDSERLKEKVEKALLPLLKELEELYRNHGVLSTSEDIRNWREKVNIRRQELFESSLSEIDDTINKEFPLRKSKEVQVHLVDILNKIIFLEEELPHPGDEERGNMHPKHVAALYQQAHELSLDIRLSQELFDRLENIMQVLQDIYKDSKNKKNSD